MSKPAAQRPARPAPTFDLAAIERAEAAVRRLSLNFDAWMAEELHKLLDARTQTKASAYSEPSMMLLFVVAHDIKGGGETYDFPLATQIAASLCKLLENDVNREKARSRVVLIDAHVDAVRAVVDGRIRSADHAVGRELLRELKAQVADLLGPDA